MSIQFNEIYETFYPQLYNYIYYRVINKETTEDLVGDVFTKILTKYSGYDSSKAALSTWIFTIAKNTVIDHYRNEKGNRSYDLSIDDIDVEDKSNSKAISLSDSKDELTFLLKNLTDLERTIIVLRYFSDLSYKQISENVGYTPKHIGVILSRTLKKLRKLVNNK